MTATLIAKTPTIQSNISDKIAAGIFSWKALSFVLGGYAAYGALTGFSANFLFFALSLAGFAIALSSSLRNATFYSMVFLCFKPALWRLAYHLDTIYSSAPQVDLFRFTAGLYLAALCIIIIAKRLLENRKALNSKLDMTIALFIGVYALSIFNPHNSPLAGLAGFERNIFPTVAVFFLASEVMKSKEDLIAFTKVITVIALVSIIYGLKHAFSGIWGFETTAFNDLFARKGFDGWLTIGIKGVEFRTFSTFFGYMEFTFTLALWGILLLGEKFQNQSKLWRTLRTLAVATMILLLSLSLERTPMLMIIAGILVSWYIRADKRKRTRIALISASVAVTIVSGIAVFEHQLEQTGIAKLQRIAELGDPTKAASIQDRVDRVWKPSFNIIAANPLGVGAGFGSQTVATGNAGGSGLQVQPHNEIMQKALEAGWIGAILFCAVIVMIFKELKRISESTHDNYIKRIAALGCGILVAFALCGQINLPFSGPQGIYFWFLSGSIISVGKALESQNDSKCATERTEALR